MTKQEMYYKYVDLLEMDDVNSILHYLFDYFSVDDLKGLLTHIKIEKGLEDG